jgi:Domain of unknown function (DUF4160)
MVFCLGGGMPCVKQITNAVSIYVYADHNPPHFHIEGPDWVVVVTLRTLSIARSSGKIPKSVLRQALEWAALNNEIIAAEWSRINERE